MTAGSPDLIRSSSETSVQLEEPAAAVLHPQGSVAAQLRAGVRVVVVRPSAAALLSLDWAGVRAHPLPPTAAADPLVRAERITVRGHGLFAGLQVELTAGVALDADDPLAVLDGHAVAAAYPVGPGTLVVLPGWSSGPDPADNALALLRAGLGVSGSPAERALAETFRTAPEPPAHPPVPAVAAGDWDLRPPAEGLGSPGFVRAAGRAGRLLPEAVHDALIDFADDPRGVGNRSGALLVRGVPVGALPPTPPSPTAAEKADLVSEFALLTVARRLGQPVGYAPEHGGALVQNILPVAGDAARQVSTSSRSTLAFHTEAAFHPHRPRYLLLLCLRGDPQAATTLCSVDVLVQGLSVRERAVLAEPRFTTRADASYREPGAEGRSARSHPRPVLTGDPERPRLWFDADLMLGTDPQAQAALDRLAELADRHATGVVLEAGDLLVVDNDLAVHGRSSFRARFDGSDRWLQRTFVVADHTTADGERDGRIIRTRFLG